MTTIPQPADPTKSYTGTFDAWNRLIKLVDTASANTVQTNAYDGRNYRTIRGTYTAGVLSETRHYYYTTGWQVVEERVGSSTAPNRQFVWGLRFIDDLIVRDRDATGGGTLNERLYAMQDPLGSVVGVANTFGAVQERYAYSPYGAPTFLTPPFGSRGSSSFDWETLFVGYRADTATSLYAVRNRVLHPRFEWLTRDPLVSRDMNSLYVYVGGNPVRRTDPLGLVPISCECPAGTWVTFDCLGLADDCCGVLACGRTWLGNRQWTGEWEIVGQVPDVPPRPERKKGPWPRDVIAEAERRRGCQGSSDDSSHHCWAVCVYGFLSIQAGIIATLAEIRAASTGWPSDLAANALGVYCGSAHLHTGLPFVLGFDAWCDLCCNTKPVA
jgi:RHS repeat-associated protein